MFPGKFIRPNTPDADQAAEISSLRKRLAAAEAKVGSSFGKEVTEQFPDAGNEDLRVFKDGKVFTVVAVADPTTALNKDPLKSKVKTNAWLGDYLDGDDDDDDDEDDDGDDDNQDDGIVGGSDDPNVVDGDGDDQEGR